MIRDSHTRLIAETLPNSELVRIDGSHFIASENPTAYNSAVMAFLKDDALKDDTLKDDTKRSRRADRLH